VRFAGEHGLRSQSSAGGLEAWRCADLLKEKDVPVLLSVDRLPRRESDRLRRPPSRTRPFSTAPASASHRGATTPADVRNLPYEDGDARAYGLPAEVAFARRSALAGESFGVADRAWVRSTWARTRSDRGHRRHHGHRTQVTHVFVDGAAQSLETRQHARLPEFKDRP